MLRAGFTEVPVIGIHTICTNTRDKPIANPAKLPAPFLGSVEPSTTNTKIKVNTASAMNACNISPSPKPFEPVAVGPSCAPVDTKAKRTAEPIMAPITWKIIYIPASFPFIRPVRNTPNVMAGLM